MDLAFVLCGPVELKQAFFGPRPQSCSRRRRTKLSVSNVRCAKKDPNEVLTTEQLDEWKRVSDLVQSVNSNLKPDDADRLVGRAFGWGTQKFWRGDVENEPPSISQVEASLSFLRQRVGLDDGSVAAVVKKFPEVLRLTLERMNANVDQIQSTYPNIKGKMLINSVTESPAILGYDFDCEGDCKSECARCWVQF